MAGEPSWSIAGSYYESCNCQAVCPCRRLNGKPGGNSTYGVCEFLLSWDIHRGQADGIDLAGRQVVMAGFYRDADPGKPWSIKLFIDERAAPEQYRQLERIFLGRAGGNMPFTSNIVTIFEVERAKMSLGHEPGHQACEGAREGQDGQNAEAVERGMEGHEPGVTPSPTKEMAEPAIGEDTFDEVLPEMRIVEPPLLLHRHVWKGAGQNRREEPHALSPRHPLLTVDLDTRHPAARRILLQHVATEIEPSQCAHALPSMTFHALGMIVPGSDLSHPHAVALTDEPQGRSRGPHARLDLGADRHPLDEFSQSIRQEAVAFVASVEADLVSE